ncbi:hypothetical protein E5Q_05381 [Mixia osmundae IAM 14324]|uniref:C3H1-type domain-containing protein n=1 Tax=Mixia osmundae (strain CBS 9802 / IAM 14324 / JCM 22182 / KY 12970) TaxID=764103 RepID=G7E783_MIXOS|nr:hypothetical protein E5Q_05381 [Mixia osmundae IAM 14324]
MPTLPPLATPPQTSPPPRRRRHAKRFGRLLKRTGPLGLLVSRAAGVMPVCAFFNTPRGCKFGTRCINQHIRSSAATGAAATGTVDPAAIRTDWSSEKPLWPLSAYGPTKHAPTLISDVEHSPEEIRLEFYQARAQNAPHLIREAALIQQADTLTKQVLANTDAVAQKANESLASTRPSQPTSGGFGASPTSAFNTAPATAFGRPTGFGNAASQPSAFGATPTAFGSTSSHPGAFGQTGFGATQTATANFGAPSAAAPAFGQSAFGSASPAPAFGQSAFGSIPAPTAGSAFGAFSTPRPVASAFAPQNASAASAIGAAPAFGIAPVTPAQAFGSTTTPAAGFGGFAGSQQASSAFSVPAFGGQSTPTAFATPAKPLTAPAFGASAFGGASSAQADSVAPGKPQAAPVQAAHADGNPPMAAPATKPANAPRPDMPFGSHQDPYAPWAPLESDLPPTVLAAYKAPAFSDDDATARGTLPHPLELAASTFCAATCSRPLIAIAASLARP